jgi:hypothetical protein
MGCGYGACRSLPCAFGLRSAKDCKRPYSQIPQDIDVVVSHGPPFGILDTAPISGLHERFANYRTRWCEYARSCTSSVISTVPMASSKQRAHNICKRLAGSALITTRTKPDLSSTRPSDEGVP